MIIEKDDEYNDTVKKLVDGQNKRNKEIEEMINIKRCKTCKFRNEEGECTSSKFADNVSWYGSYDDTEEEQKEHDEKVRDMLLYSYDEGGSFFVGEDFGCVHYEK
jgi:hypothetical protein